MNQTSKSSNNNFLSYLLDAEQPEYLYIVKAFLTITPIALFIGYVVIYFFPESGQYNNTNSSYDYSTFWVIARDVVISPFIETLVMIPILAFLKKLFGDQIFWLALFSALIWSALHFYVMPARGVVSLFSFFILSLSFLIWDKISRRKAIFVTFTIHAINNAAVVIIYNLH